MSAPRPELRRTETDLCFPSPLTYELLVDPDSLFLTLFLFISQKFKIDQILQVCSQTQSSSPSTNMSGPAGTSRGFAPGFFFFFFTHLLKGVKHFL